MDDAERQAIFLIADISGYTKFIFSNEKEISHSQMVIRELITTLLEEVADPLQLIRIEGDAIFLYAFKDDPAHPWKGSSQKISSNLMSLFQVFSDKMSELTIHKVCNCTACVNIEHLKLKMVLHSGPAAFYQVNGHQELTGTSPIIIHRLLKNSIEATEYLMLTQTAYEDLPLPIKEMEIGMETYDDIGSIKTYVYYPPAAEPYVPSPGAKTPLIFVETLRAEVSKEYARVATNPALGFHFHTGRRLASLLEYQDEWLEGLSEEAIESFAGTGNHFSVGEIRSADRVLDVGCGASLYCLIAAKMAGSGGEVIGVDMTEEMVEKAAHNARSVSAHNVSFRRGVLEELPVEDAWADVVISNGSINLAPDKDAVFAELSRVLKPGGRLQMADILVEKPIPESAKRNIDLWTG